MAFDQQSVKTRVDALCPESAKIKPEAVGFHIEDAMSEVTSAFSRVGDDIKLRASYLLASHYCAVTLYQNSQSYSEENFGTIEDGEVGSTSGGAIKVNEYKDKKQEFFEKKKSNNGGQAIMRWGGRTTPEINSLASTSYGQEYLRLLNLHVPQEPFLVGNSTDSDLGRDYTG